MSKGIVLGTFSADGDLDISVEAFAASRYSVFVTGSFGGGTIAVLGGDGTAHQPVKITNPANATLHSSVEISTIVGLYTFDALCSSLRFTLSGSTNPDLTLTLFPEPRS